MSVNGVLLPVAQINFLHSTQHHLQQTELRYRTHTVFFVMWSFLNNPWDRHGSISHHLQLFGIKILQILLRKYFIETLKERLSLFLNSTRQPPFCYQSEHTQNRHYTPDHSEKQPCVFHYETEADLMYSSLFSSVTWMFPPSGFRSWVVTSPRISLSTEKNISSPHSSILLSL